MGGTHIHRTRVVPRGESGLWPPHYRQAARLIDGRSSSREMGRWCTEQLGATSQSKKPRLSGRGFSRFRCL